MLHLRNVNFIILGCTDLGVFGKSIVDGQSGPGGDLALVGTFFVVVLVGTFASQVRRELVLVEIIASQARQELVLAGAFVFAGEVGTIFY